MTNEEKLRFIQFNYVNARASELMPADKKEIFLRQWAEEALTIVPRCLYKYKVCNENNLNMIRNRTAWFSCPSTWNDPIDVTVSYDLEKDFKMLKEKEDELATKMALTFINKYIESFCEQKKFVTAEEVKKVYYGAFKGENSINPKKIIAYLTPIVGEKPAKQIAVKTQEAFSMVNTPKFREQVFGGLEKMMHFNDIRDTMLMYSLSETYENNHQWAMYADGGKGFCIGYHVKPKTEREWSLIPNLLPIYYGDKRPLMITRMLDEALEYVVRPETLQDLINQEAESLYISLNTKTLQWIGEEEWRFGIPKLQAETNAVPFDFAESLYLGENIEEEWKEKLLEIAKEQGLCVYQRKLDSTKSKWIYAEILLNEHKTPNQYSVLR